MGLTSLYDVAAPAKINRFLHVVGRRADGYHLLQSVFELIDWTDTLHFELRADAQIRRQDLGDAVLPPEDLCVRAARALQAAAGVAMGVDITIDKRIPSGAGLGGGSSDAATTLLALNQLWRLRWSRRRLLTIAQTLGADVPFFVGGRNAWVEGIGEVLTPLMLPPRWLAVLKPAVFISTPAIFSSPLLERENSPAILSDFLASQMAADEQGKPCEFGRNDLQKPAQVLSSDIAKAIALLESSFGNGRMTGSGSAVFAQAGTGDRPWAPMIECSALPQGWIGRMCRSLEAHPLQDWADDSGSA